MEKMNEKEFNYATEKILICYLKKFSAEALAIIEQNEKEAPNEKKKLDMVLSVLKNAVIKTSIDLIESSSLSEMDKFVLDRLYGMEGKLDFI